MTNDRFIIVKAAIDSETEEIIPVWDNRLIYIEDNYEYQIDNERVKLIDVVFDTKHKVLSIGTIINLYPNNNDFEVNESVYVETGLGFKTGIYKSRITDILYQYYEQLIIKGHKIEEHTLNKVKESYADLVIKSDHIYCINHWIPYYVLEDESIIKNSYSLHKVFDKKV